MFTPIGEVSSEEGGDICCYSMLKISVQIRLILKIPVQIKAVISTSIMFCEMRKNSREMNSAHVLTFWGKNPANNRNKK